MPVARTAPNLLSGYVVTVQASVNAGRKVRLHVPESVLDGSNAASARNVEFMATIMVGNVDLISMFTAATEQKSEVFQVDLN